MQRPVGLPLYGGLLPGELREYVLLHMEVSSSLVVRNTPKPSGL
jgi:hypothetical protein